MAQGFTEWGALSLTQWQAYVRSVAGRAGLRLSWSDDGSASTDGRTIRLPRPSTKWNREDAQKLLALAIHETSHVQHSDMPRALELAEKDPLQFKVFNIIEDDRIEAIPSREWPGDKLAFEATAAPTVERFLRGKVAQLGAMAGAARDAEAKLLGVAVWNCQQRAQWAPQYMPNPAEMAALPPDVRAIVKKLDDSGVSKMLDASRYDETLEGSRAFMRAAKRITELLEFTKEEQEAAQAQEVEGGGVGADGGKHEEMFAGESEDLSEDVPEDLKDPTGVAPRIRKSGSYNPSEPREWKLVDETKSKHTLERNENVDIPAEPADLRGVAGRVRRLLQIASEVQRTHGHKSGRKLHGPALYRVPLNIPGLSERVFSRKETALDLDIAAGVLLDGSGSMGGSKMGQACLAGASLCDVLGNVLGIPTMAGIFSSTSGGEYGEVPKHALCRRLDERMVPKAEMLARLNKAAGDMMCNNLDGEAVAWMTSALLVARAKRRVLFVLSDGFPATYRPGDPYVYLKDVVADAVKRGVEVWGIGIQSDAVSKFYPKYRVLTDSSDLAKIVVELAGEQILSGGK